MTIEESKMDDLEHYMTKCGELSKRIKEVEQDLDREIAYKDTLEQAEAKIKELEKFERLYELELERVKKAEDQHWKALLQIKELEKQVDFLRIQLDEVTYYYGDRIKELEDREKNPTVQKIMELENDLEKATNLHLDAALRVKELEEIVKENTRLSNEWQECHSYNNEIVSENQKLKARIKELEEGIDKVIKWRNFDGDGITDPLRKELYTLLKK
jgi:DNA repair exonuclease SbcCD ATPase subunit